MHTPWGLLSNLDANDVDLAFQIIFSDKDTLVEGLVVENTFDQILQPLMQDQQNPFTVLNIETVIASHEGKRYAFVWARDFRLGLGRYLQALCNVTTVYLTTFTLGDFWAEPYRDGGRVRHERERLTDVAQNISGRKPKTRQVHASVRDPERIKSAFWGFLSNVYGDDLWAKVILPRLFINHGLSPYFPQVWNLDRVCLYRGRLWLLEVKHKFPFGNDRLCFGINKGELQNISLLQTAGIQCLHALLIKPDWNKGASAMYLFNQRSLKDRVAVIAMNLGKEAADLLTTKVRKAPNYTSASGETTVEYFLLHAQKFAYMGTLAESDPAIAGRLRTMLDGKSLEPINDDVLKSLRVEDLHTGGKP